MDIERAPRRGIAWVAAGLLIGALTIDGWSALPLAASGLGAVLVAHPVPLRRLLRRLGPFAVFAALALVFGMFRLGGPADGAQGGDAVLVLGPLYVGRAALHRASLAACRLLYVGVWASWLGLAVGTARLLGALHHAGRWIERLGIDVTAVLLALGVAIRFLPLVQHEARLRQRAWEARGATLLARGVVGRMRYAALLSVPLMAASLRRAEALAEAIEARLGGEAAPRWGSHSKARAAGTDLPRSLGVPGQEKDMAGRGQSAGLADAAWTWLAITAAWLPVAAKIWKWVA